MNTTTTRGFLRGASLTGAQGFALAFGVLGVVSHLITLNITEFNANLALTTLLFAGAGALGAASLATEANWRSYGVLFALAGFIGCGGGYMLTTLSFVSRAQLEKMNATLWQGIHIVQFAIIGALTGLFIGIALWKWRASARLVIAGGLGFGIGYLVQVSLNDLVAEWLSDWVTRFAANDLVHMLLAGLLWGLGSAVCGLLGGAALGLALER